MKGFFIYKYIVWTALIILTYACANVVSPSGGPKDEDPPTILRSTPPNFSTMYRGERIRVFFDEYVMIKEFNQNFLASPPLEILPDVRIRGRSIIIDVEDTLKPNTTYTLFFGESIVDLTEGNAIPNFSFVFSTGDYVDSLSIRGRVSNAFDLRPSEDVFVMLYDDLNDSIPMHQKPVYISKTNPKGEFIINNMRMGQYKIFVLRDSNFNYLYDSLEEEIAFLDSILVPQYFDISEPLNSEQEEDPSVEEHDPELSEEKKDSIAQSEREQYLLSLTNEEKAELAGVGFYEMKLFLPKDTIQNVLFASFVGVGKFEIHFRSPVKDFKMNSLSSFEEDIEFLKEFNSRGDTLTIWTPGLIADSLILEVIDSEVLHDTLRLSTTPRSSGRSRGRVSEEVETPKISISSPNLNGSVLPYYRSFELKSQTPLRAVDFGEIQVYENDSIPIDVEWEFVDNLQRRMQSTKRFAEGLSYSLSISDSVLMDVFGAYNDSIGLRFRVDKREDYGNILMNISLPQENQSYILQLLGKEDRIILEQTIDQSGVYKFENLKADTFNARLIVDANKNGVWDTGDYMRKLQPEQVFMFNQPIESRLNWDVEVVWDVSEK